ncbi:cupredoxin domain-containing protein [Candidatus Woesearchaeota archaeon]|nr:cupredoxin domain-containing protein [Candidatus Woesearchaeota archaeon]
MKQIMILLVLLMIIGCSTEPAAQEPISGKVTAPATASSDGQVKTFEVRLLKQGFVPETIEVNKGDTVRLYVATASEHTGFRIEGLDIEERLPKEESAVIEFTADKSGVFEYNCGIYCGAEKEAMIGKLIVH